MRLVADWKRSWRWLSVHCLALAGSIPAAWVWLPDDLKRHIPPDYMGAITAVVAVCGIVGRLVDQGKKP
ncbi:hypothetical protein [Pantoea sp. At-9b]|uniref:DUF7940 domain-containing protein n=1 Tax=Pantoea sp. (strain At-9b) TaxID=592316 RepID=UPI0002D32292|nr:hypothetical protein [Pantoea sp. At-9b]